jgi:hypothetical protein
MPTPDDLRVIRPLVPGLLSVRVMALFAKMVLEIFRRENGTFSFSY